MGLDFGFFSLHCIENISTGILLNLGKRGFGFKQTTVLFHHADLTILHAQAKVKHSLLS